MPCVCMCTHADLYMCRCIWFILPTLISRVVLAKNCAKCSISILWIKKNKDLEKFSNFPKAKVCKLQIGIQTQAVWISTYLLNTSTLHNLRSILKCSFFSSFVFYECSSSWGSNSGYLYLLLATNTIPQDHTSWFNPSGSHIVVQLELGHYQLPPHMTS